MNDQWEFLNRYNIVSVTPLLKGWSKDKKYVLTDANDRKYLLRISVKELYDKKKKQFELLKLLRKPKFIVQDL